MGRVSGLGLGSCFSIALVPFQRFAPNALVPSVSHCCCYQTPLSLSIGLLLCSPCFWNISSCYLPDALFLLNRPILFGATWSLLPCCCQGIPIRALFSSFPNASTRLSNLAAFLNCPYHAPWACSFFSNALIPASGLLSLLTACPFKAVCAIVSLPQLPCAVCSRFRRILLALAGLPRILKV